MKDKQKSLTPIKSPLRIADLIATPGTYNENTSRGLNKYSVYTDFYNDS